MDLTPKIRAGMPSSSFALPGKRFPMNDAPHARLAIGGATRAMHAGNISEAEASAIKNKARAKLGLGMPKMASGPMAVRDALVAKLKGY